MGFLRVVKRPEDGGPTIQLPAAVRRCTLLSNVNQYTRQGAVTHPLLVAVFTFDLTRCQETPRHDSGNPVFARWIAASDGSIVQNDRHH
jgi:hypothetical protein